VNHVPQEDAAGLSVYLSQSAIDAWYFYQLLAPSVPYTPASVDSPTRQAVVDAFNVLKSDANALWKNVSFESSEGITLDYKPSLLTPEDWANQSNNAVWTSASFQVGETAPSQGVELSKTRLWRLRVSDSVLEEALQDKVVSHTALLLKAAEVKPPGQFLQTPHAALHVPALSKPPTVLAQDPPAAPGPTLVEGYRQSVRFISPDQRIALGQYVGSRAPTAPAQISTASISFEYCLVSIRRPWYMDAFISNRSWCIPLAEQGALTAGGTPGGLALMPVGLVAIRNLNIAANWTQADTDVAQQATHFGPFQINSSIDSGKIGHPGIQIVAWLLENMPSLPPNSWSGVN